jgi:hypothetical protein
MISPVATRLFQKQPPKMTYGLLCLVLALTWGIIGKAHAENDTESAVKIGFLYNFFKFIDWPSKAGANYDYCLCTTGLNSLGDGLLALQDKTINNKRLSIKRGVSGKELKNCHMVFISTDEDPRKAISDSQGLAVVTVSDKPDFINQGGIIGLIQINNRLAFEVNLGVAKAANIRISAQMLELAKRINDTK